MPKPKNKTVYTLKSESFLGTVKDFSGKKVLVLDHKPYYDTWIQKNTKVGDKLSTVITNKKLKRSLAQNASLFGVYYPLIAEETGDYDQWLRHERYKEKFLLIAEHRDKDGRVRYETKSSSDLSVLEFMEFVMKIEADCGVMAPPIENQEEVTPYRGKENI